MSFNIKDNKMSKFVSFWSLEGKIRNFEVFEGYTWNSPLKILSINILQFWKQYIIKQSIMQELWRIDAK